MRIDAKKLTVLGMLVIAAGALLPANPAMGVISATGDIVPPYDGSSDPWVIGGDLKIGNTGAANMTLSGTSRVTAINASYMAYSSGSTANVLLADPGSLWDSLARLYIGGTDTQAGGTAVLTIAAGRVETSQAVIWGGGTLAGNGTLKAPSVTSWGTIRPGGSIGTLTIDGNITFQPSSVLEVEVNNSGASDRLAVTGDVGIVGGTVRAISTDTIVGAKEYTILTAHSVTGTFTTLDTALLDVAMVDPNERLAYTANTVLLRITANRFDLAIAGNENQQALGVALQEIAERGGTAVTGALQQLPTLNDVRNAYDQLSGQSRPPLASIVATDTTKFMGIISNRLQGARGAVAQDLHSLSDSPLLAMAEPDSGIGSPTGRSWDNFLWDLGPDTGRGTNQGWGTWGKLYGLFGDRKTDNGVTGYSFNFLGQSAGVEAQLTDRFIGGVTGGHSSGQVDYDTVADEADVSTTHAGLYSTYSGDGWYLNSIVTRSWIDVHTERVVDLLGQRHEGYFDGREWSGYIEAGLDWQPAESWLVQPLAAFQATLLHLNQYSEETGLTTTLVFEDQQYESYKASIGAKVTRELLLGAQGLPAVVQGRGRWVHEFGDVTSSVEARFQDVPTISWTVADEAVARDSLLLGVGAGIRLTKGLRAFVDYDTNFNADKTVHVISGALDYRW